MLVLKLVAAFALAQFTPQDL